MFTCIKKSGLIRTSITGGVFELLNSHDKKLALGYLVDIREQNGLEEACA